jgi:hypothetical protein
MLWNAIKTETGDSSVLVSGPFSIGVSPGGVCVYRAARDKKKKSKIHTRRNTWSYISGKPGIRLRRRGAAANRTGYQTFPERISKGISLCISFFLQTMICYCKRQ